MVNQHSNFHVFRTESYNTSTWPIYLELLKDKKEIIDKKKCAMLPLENYFFRECVISQKEHIFNDLLGWTRWVMKWEFQQRGYVHLHEIAFLPNGHDLFKIFDEKCEDMDKIKDELDKIHDI
jgi:hypothetical protein